MPGVPIDGAPGNVICYNGVWGPAILGALKSLARPETWEGTEAEINDAVQEATGLLAITSEYGFCPQCPNWELGLRLDFCDQMSIDATLYNVGACDGCQTPSVFLGVATQPPFGSAGIYVAEVAGFDLGSGALVGGLICEAGFNQVGSLIGNVWTLTWRDCLGNTHIENGAGLNHRKESFEAKDFCMSSLAPFVFTVSIVGNWLCGPA